MNGVPIDHALGLAVVLFAIGATTLLVRRNVVFILVAIEIMLNAAGLAFVAAGARWEAADGQVMFIFILTMAAAEVCVGLAIALRLFAAFRTLDVDAANTMRG
jgi:NADH-quinone oxidoreductase subunit K